MWLHGYSQFITEGFGKAQRLHSFWVASLRCTAVTNFFHLFFFSIICHKKVINLIKLAQYLKTPINNPNTIKSYKILQKLSPKHTAHGVAQSTYPIYRHGKACLSKQPPWRAAGDPRLARSRSRVRAPGPAGALRALFFSTLPSSFGR